MIEQHTIAILDDEPLILAALTAELSGYYDVSVVARNDKDLFLNIHDHQPELVLLDILLGETSGVDVAKLLREKYPQVKILVLSTDDRRDTFRRLLEVGIDGFISKQASPTEVVHAVDVVIRGEKYYGKDISRLIKEIQVSMLSGGEPSLTRLEVDILYACCEGKNAAEIGQLLHMSPRTVEAHKSTLFVKLGVDNTTELIVTAIRQGIISV